KSVESQLSRSESDTVPKVAKMTVSGKKQTMGFEVPGVTAEENGHSFHTPQKGHLSEDTSITASDVLETVSKSVLPSHTIQASEEQSSIPTPVKKSSKLKQQIDVKAELEKRQGGKQLLNLVVIGNTLCSSGLSISSVNWQQERFQEITGKLGHFLKQAGFKESDVAFIPTSGLSGENLITRSQSNELTKWYKGLCLLEQIDSFKPPQRSVDKPFRLCVSDVFKDQGSGFCVTGKIEAGYIQIGDRLLAIPPNETCTAKGITLHDEPVDWAAAGDHVSLTLVGMDIIKINVGCIFCGPKEPIKACTRFRARILIFNIEVPITKGFPFIAPLIQSNAIEKENEFAFVELLTKGQNALVELQTQRPVALELYKDFKELGRFMLRYSGSTIAAGVVTEVF
ncbi:hypothetical protein MC885_005613, partial [Smutsia gigantea]